jgi:DNA-binding response OmpR family regulator
MVSAGVRNRAILSARMPKGLVFLVEDEVMIRMMVADMLQELGYRVAAEAGRIEEAIGLLENTDFDIAIVDVNLHGELVFPVAEAIKARNRPFIFATGYSTSALPAEFRDRPALQKPFQIEMLGKLIEVALKSHRSGGLV